MAEQAQPPWLCMVVAMVIAVALMLVIGWPFLRDGDPLNQELARFHAQQLREAKPLRHEALPVVILGTSLIKYAILPSAQFAVLAEQAGSPPVQLVRLVAITGLEALDDNLLTELAELGPFVFLVQDHVIFYEDPRRGHVGFSRFAKDRLRGLLGLRGDRPSPTKQVLDFYNIIDDHRRQVSEREIAAARADRIRQYTGSPRPDVLQAIGICRQSGGVVYIVTMPSDPRWKVTLDDNRAAIRQHIDHLVESGTVEELVCPLVFSGDDYLDYFHLSPQASDRYTRWLVKELARRVKR